MEQDDYNVIRDSIRRDSRLMKIVWIVLLVAVIGVIVSLSPILIAYVRAKIDELGILCVTLPLMAIGALLSLYKVVRIADKCSLYN